MPLSSSTTPRSSPSRMVELAVPPPVPLEVHRVALFKDKVYEDFGFSVSDGLQERGIFVNRIRRGGPADLSSLLRPLDRILQINETRTTDFDCCLAVPLIAAAGDKIELVVARTSQVFQLRPGSEEIEERRFSRGSGEFSNCGDRTLTRASRKSSHYASAGAKRISARTSSADGRLYSGGGGGAGTASPAGSVTNQIVPWNASPN